MRYLIEGAPAGIAFFVSLYDVFDNMGLAMGETPAAMAACAGNACSLWGDTYTLHQSWGVAFFDRFVSAPAIRTNALYIHLAFNSAAFVLMHVQLLWSDRAVRVISHAWLGRLTMIIPDDWDRRCALSCSEHDAVKEYGGIWAEWGFYSMSLCVFGAAMMGWRMARRGDWAMHRVWMIRFAGAMYGAFWLFRALLVVTGPLFREWETASLLISIWVSAPLGLLIAEGLRRRWESQSSKASPVSLSS